MDLAIDTQDSSTATLDITKVPQGIIVTADPDKSEFQNALTAFALAVTYQTQPAREASDDVDAHDPDFILPGTYRTLINNARVLAALVPHVTTVTEITRVRGKALQLLMFERAMLENKSEAFPRGKAFIAKYIRRENQGAYLKALRFALRALAAATDRALAKMAQPKVVTE